MSQFPLGSKSNSIVNEVTFPVDHWQKQMEYKSLLMLNENKLGGRGEILTCIRCLHARFCSFGSKSHFKIPSIKRWEGMGLAKIYLVLSTQIQNVKHYTVNIGHLPSPTISIYAFVWKGSIWGCLQRYEEFGQLLNFCARLAKLPLALK